MAITVKHPFVSTVPDAADTSIVRPSNWNADHTVTGLGTAAELNAGVANGVATLDGSGTVPISQLPAAVLGALSYQGTWNASTNTPTLTSSVGTKGYYYVVSVAGSTNLNGITDWKVGDWAVYNGTAWQKVDNTDSVTSVNGYTGTVVLSYTDVGAFPATSTTGSGNVVLATGATLNNPNISNYEAWTLASAPSYVEGLQWYDSTAHSLAYYNDSANSVVHIGQDIQVKVINNTGSTIANGSPVYITSTSSGQTYPNVALAKADVAATSAVIGLTNGAIANGAIGYVTSQGGIDNVNTGSFTVGQVLYLSPYSAGQLQNTIPPTGITVQVGVVSYVNSSTGKIYVKQTTPLAVPASIITGTLGVDHGGTGATTLTGYVKGSGTSAMTASATIPTTDLSGTVTNAQLANSAITINGTNTSLGGSISVGTVTSVTGTSPVVSSGGNTPAISMPAATSSVNGYLTSADWTTFNSKQPAGTYVTSVTGTTGRTTSSGGTTPAIDLASGIVTAGTTGSSSLIPVITVDTYGRVTSITTASNPQGTVTSVTGGTYLTGGTITTSGTLAVDATTTATASKVVARDSSANISTNNLLNGYTSVTSAGGTTTLTTASSYFQKLSGSSNQTFQLPDATSLPLGFSFVFDNDSTGTLTINDGSGAAVDTVPTGNITYVFLETAGSVAGSWGKYSYIPAAVNTPTTGTLLSSVTAPAANPITGTPSSSTYLRGDGTWSAVTPTPAGSNTQVQYNGSGAFAASSSFTFDGTILTSPVMSVSNGIYENPNTIATNYTITTNSNAMSAGPITINTGVTVTVPTGSTWVIV